jgi:hypothetical protein
MSKGLKKNIKYMLHREILEMVERWLENDEGKIVSYTNFYNKNDLYLFGNLLGDKENEIKINVKPYFQQLIDLKYDTYLQKVLSATLWQYILQGKMKYLIQETPPCQKDKQISENDQLLKSYIDCTRMGVTDAYFRGGNFAEDGVIKFKNPPIITMDSFPVEFGYCKVTQFYSNIMTKRCVARLPYDMEYIIYFELTEDLFDICI